MPNVHHGLSVYVVVCMFSLGGCKTSGPTGPGDLSPKAVKSASAEIRQVLDVQAAAWNRGDLKGFMIGYLNSPSLRFASNNSVFHGYEGAYKSYTKAFSDKEKLSKLKFSQLDIQLLSTDSAMVFGRFTNEYGDDKPSKTGLFTLIMKKTRKGWRIIHDHSSDAREKQN